MGSCDSLVPVVVSLDEFDPGRPIDVDGVRKDVEEIVRQGFSSFSVAELQELRYFLSCFSTGRTDIVTLEGAEISAHAIREHLTRHIHGLPETLVRRPVAEAILGIDSETAGLKLQGRQVVAGMRYSPASPVGFEAIRKKPYGQQWKLVKYLADRLIASERSTRFQSYADYSDWDVETPLPEGVLAVVMTEEGYSAGVGEVHKADGAPGLLSDSELEASLGYRWLEYERTLVCSHDLSTLTLTTRVLIQIKTRGTRIFVHRFPTWVSMGVTLPAPTVSLSVPQGYAPVAYIGRVCYSAKHPTWWLDFFDFGSGEYDDQFYLAFDHVYDNPERGVPSRVTAIPEFAGLRHFRLSGYRLLEDGETREAFQNSCDEVSPMRGDEYVWLVQSSPELRRYQLKDPADWQRFKKLQRQSNELHYAATGLDYQMRDLVRVVKSKKEVDKEVQ
jgi:hypothetical protein